MDFRPQLHRWRFNQRRGKREDVQIVVEMPLPATMLCTARDPRMALAIVADAAHILSLWIGEKNVRAEIHLLRRSLQASGRTGEWS